MSSAETEKPWSTNTSDFVARSARAARDYVIATPEMLGKAPIHRGHKWERTITNTLIVFTFLYFLSDLLHNLPSQSPNLLEMTGCVASIWFLIACRDVKANAKRVAERLAERGVLVFRKLPTSPDAGEEIVHQEDKNFRRLLDMTISDGEERAEAWSRRCATLFLALSLAYLYFGFDCAGINWEKKICAPLRWNGNFGYFSLISFLIFRISVIILCGWFVGAFLGRMSCYGYRMRSYRRLRVDGHGIGLIPSAGHVDGKCGLRPINDFLFSQTLRVVILVIYLIVWHFILFALSDPAGKAIYATDKIDLLFLFALGLIIALQVMGLGVPIWSVRRRVLDEKIKLESEADGNWRKAEELRIKLKNDLGSATREELEKRITEHEKSYRDVEAMRLWPLTLDSGRAFLLLGVQALPLIYAGQGMVKRVSELATELISTAPP